MGEKNCLCSWLWIKRNVKESSTAIEGGYASVSLIHHFTRRNSTQKILPLFIINVCNCIQWITQTEILYL